MKLQDFCFTETEHQTWDGLTGYSNFVIFIDFQSWMPILFTMIFNNRLNMEKEVRQ